MTILGTNLKKSEHTTRTKTLLQFSAHDPEPLVHLGLNINPHLQNLRVAKRQYLSTHQARNAVLAITPPPAIRQARPVPAVRAAARRGAVAHHERQPPALRRITRHGIELRDGVGQVRLRGRNRLPARVGELRSLVGEHEVHGFRGEELVLGLGTGAVVEEDREEFCICVLVLGCP